jgi:hypothetical protein
MGYANVLHTTKLKKMTDNTVSQYFQEAAEQLKPATTENVKAHFARQQWFLARVGKTVYRNHVSCKCKHCEDVYTEGVLLTESGHAQYVFDCECDANREGEPLMYFDTVVERDEFEQAVKGIESIEYAEGLENCIEGIAERLSLTDAVGIATFKRIIRNYIKLNFSEVRV